jgi:hypothetical protein
MDLNWPSRWLAPRLRCHLPCSAKFRTVHSLCPDWFVLGKSALAMFAESRRELAAWLCWRVESRYLPVAWRCLPVAWPYWPGVSRFRPAA